MINYSEYCAYDENKFVPNLPAPLKKKKPIEEVEVPHKKTAHQTKEKKNVGRNDLIFSLIQI